MDGDIPDLRGLAALREEFGFFWILDEAHALGWYGPGGAGLAAREGISGQVDLLVGTLGKGLGSMGAFTLFHDPHLRQQLINFAGEFIYSTYLAPACAAIALEALRIIRALDPADQKSLHALSVEWRLVLRGHSHRAPEGDSPIVPVVLGDASHTMACANRLREAGYAVGAVRPPTVPVGSARLRISLRRGLPRSMAVEIGRLLSEEQAKP
jgi:8-amino-7-oxononanoate synthase